MAYAWSSRIGQTSQVPIQKIAADNSVPMTGFVVTDLGGATRATGVVRSAKKILMDGAKTMARSQTYAWAILEEQISGASAGVSVDPAGKDAGMAAFVEAVLGRVTARELSLDPAKGVSSEDLRLLDEADSRSKIGQTARTNGTLNEELLAAGAFVSAAQVHGPLEGRRVILEGTSSATASFVAAAASHGAVVVGIATANGALLNPNGFDLEELLGQLLESGPALGANLGTEAPASTLFEADSDLVFCGSKLGLIDHEIASRLSCKALVPIGPAPVTAKGLAVATSRGITVLPDFVSASGPLFADHPEEAATAEQVLRTANESILLSVGELADHPEGHYLGACYAAESFLRTWQEELPFGRPLA